VGNVVERIPLPRLVEQSAVLMREDVLYVPPTGNGSSAGLVISVIPRQCLMVRGDSLQVLPDIC
jgi:hypothetical protein